jgi:hypothetical protein
MAAILNKTKSNPLRKSVYLNNEISSGFFELGMTGIAVGNDFHHIERA